MPRWCLDVRQRDEIGDKWVSRSIAIREFFYHHLCAQRIRSKSKKVIRRCYFSTLLWFSLLEILIGFGFIQPVKLKL